LEAYSLLPIKGDFLMFSKLLSDHSDVLIEFFRFGSQMAAVAKFKGNKEGSETNLKAQSKRKTPRKSGRKST